MSQIYQIAEYIRLANKALAYSKYIVEYPTELGKIQYDFDSLINNFFIKTCNVFFNESLLLVMSLLDKDTRVISLFNNDKFSVHIDILDSLVKSNEYLNLKTIRDQIIAHQDSDHATNQVPSYRERFIIDDSHIKNIDYIIQIIYGLVSLIDRSYTKAYFDDGLAKKEIHQLMDLAPPVLQ